MQVSQIPAKFVIPFANGATVGLYKRTIPVPSQGNTGAASLTDGFPPICFLPAASGGLPVDGRDFNGIFFEITQWLQWFQAGAPTFFDSGLSGTIGGYPKQAVVAASGTIGGYWLNTVDNNLTNPEAGGANWTFFSVIQNSVTTGDHKWRPTAEILIGWVRANGLTIGNAFSNATERANADTLALFTWVWTNFTDAQCPLLTSVGGASSRGASAAIDFAANKQATLPDMRGNWPGGVDTMGNVSAGRLATATFSVGNASTTGSRGNFVQPQSGPTNAAAAMQTGTFYVKL